MIKFFNKSNIAKTQKITIILLFLILFVFVLGNILLITTFNFISDDLSLLKSSIFHPFPLFSKWDLLELQYYRPIIFLSFYFNYLLGKYYPFGYYLLNLLIHISCSAIIYKLLLDIFYRVKHKREIFITSFLCALTFLILPQNITNIYWISGRTDLIMSLFVFTALIFAIKYINSNSIIYLFIYCILLILSATSKESWIIIFPYLGIIHIIKKDIKFYNIKRFYLIVFSSFVILFMYFLLRYFLFGHFFGEDDLYFTFDRFVKFNLYAIYSILIPIDILEYYYFYKNNFFIFILISISILLIAFYFTLVFYKYKIEKRFVFVLLTLISTFFIYIKSFPTMRLMYSIFPIIAIALILISKQIQANKKHTIYLFLLPFTLILIIGYITNIVKYNSINKYNEMYYNILPDNVLTDYKIIDLSPLLSIGQSFALPESNIMMDIKINGKITTNDYNIVIKPFLFQSYAFSNPLNSISYKTINRNEIIINLQNEYDAIMATKEISPNYRYDNSFYQFKDGIVIIPKEYLFERNGYLKSLKIIIPDYLISQNTYILFQNNGLLKLLNIIDFFTFFEIKQGSK